MTADLLDDPFAWGQRLIETGDHDPLYGALASWGVRGSRVRRFLLAYWLCYSVGASWYISQRSGQTFWGLLQAAAENHPEGGPPVGVRWPRAHERRHWRGQKAVDSVKWLREKFRHPEEAVLSLEGARTLREVEDRITAWPLFGPWIAFKAADMLERVLDVPVEFPGDIITLYKDPREGAEMMVGLGVVQTPQEAADIMLRHLSALRVPGRRVRQVNIQEVETCLCKWKATRRGHYRIGKDTVDHRRELELWGAHDLLGVYPLTLSEDRG